MWRRCPSIEQEEGPARSQIVSWKAPCVQERARRCELMGDGGELDDYFCRVRVDVDRALGEMAGSEVALHAAAPRADKGEIQHPANYGACEGDEAAHPFFGGFLAEFYGNAFR